MNCKFCIKCGNGLQFNTIENENNVIEIALFIIVEYGLNIGTIGETIRSSVKYNVEKFTGMEVASVQVNVESVRVD